MSASQTRVTVQVLKDDQLIWEHWRQGDDRGGVATTDRGIRQRVAEALTEALLETGFAPSSSQRAESVGFDGEVDALDAPPFRPGRGIPAARMLSAALDAAERHCTPHIETGEGGMVEARQAYAALHRFVHDHLSGLLAGEG